MQALTISAHGGFDRIEVANLPIPEVTDPASVRLKMRPGALNHLDLFVIGGLPGVTIGPNWILGADGCGVIDQLGGRVAGLSKGDRVIINPGISDRSCEYCLDGEQPLCPKFGILGEHLPGVFAEYAIVPAANVRRIPDSISDADAAAFTLATLTAWRMVVTRARVEKDEQVLIWGIGGGVAQAAMRICLDRGATVWVTSSDERKLDRAKELGAHETINHRGVDVGKLIRERTGKRGVDVVVDNVGQATWQQSLGALGRRGRLVTCGATSGPEVKTDVRRLFWNQWSILGSTMGNDAEFEAITDELHAGRLRPVVDEVLPLSEGRAAFERLAAGEQFGKIVLSINPR